MTTDVTGTTGTVLSFFLFLLLLLLLLKKKNVSLVLLMLINSQGFGVPLGDALDHRIETLLKDWHHSPDLLYAVHPLDGSYLVW